MPMSDKDRWPQAISDISPKPVRLLVERFVENARDHIKLLRNYAGSHGDPFAFFLEDILLKCEEDGNYENDGCTPAAGFRLKAVVVRSLVPGTEKADHWHWSNALLPHHIALSVEVRWRARDIKISDSGYPMCGVYGGGREKGKRVAYHTHGHTLLMQPPEYAEAAKLCAEATRHEAMLAWFRSKCPS